jgi:hypothetical protein
MVSVIFIIIIIIITITNIGIAFANKSEFLLKYPFHLSLSLA